MQDRIPKFAYYLATLSLFVAATSCTANWVIKDYRARAGVVSYLNQGADAVIEDRERDAHDKIKQFCRGSYEILTEEHSQAYAGSYAAGSARYGRGQASAQAYSFPMYNDYVYLRFKCD